VTLDKIEKWTEAKYGITDLPEDTISGWKNSNVENLMLPEKNRFLSENFDIKESPSRDWTIPQNVFEEKRGELWFKSDKIFNLPRGIVSISLRSSATRETARSSAELKIEYGENMAIFCQNFDFWPKFIFCHNFVFLSYKLSIFVNNLICDQYFEL